MGRFNEIKDIINKARNDKLQNKIVRKQGNLNDNNIQFYKSHKKAGCNQRKG